jgi:hypothetical protein
MFVDIWNKNQMAFIDFLPSFIIVNNCSDNTYPTFIYIRHRFTCNLISAAINSNVISRTLLILNCNIDFMS